MEFTAQTKSVRISPRKVRLVADSIRKLSLDTALNTLTVVKKRGSYPLLKTLESAVSNAVNNGKAQKDNLFIKSIDVTEAQALKRYHPSTRGRIHPYKRRGSHITIVLAEKVKVEEKKKEGKIEKKEEVKK